VSTRSAVTSKSHLQNQHIYSYSLLASCVSDFSRRKTLALIGVSTSVLGSGCMSAFDLQPEGDADHTPTQTTETNHTPTQTTETSTNRLRYEHDVRKQAQTSGKPLSAVASGDPWTTTNGSVASTGWHGPGGDAGVEL